jgi:Pyruvate/2-oxoacid:ferredoxin oxidoreductase delta subunit
MVKKVPVVPSADPGNAAAMCPAVSVRECFPVITEQSLINPLIYLFCTEGAISHHNKLFDINLSICKGCGICACESQGIELVLEYTGPKGVF